MRHFDVVVIGSGPAGQKAAIQAAKLGRKVALIEREDDLGGVCINTGTIPSKALREVALLGTGGRHFRTPGTIEAERRHGTVKELMDRCQPILRAEREVIHGHLRRNGVELIRGEGCLVGPNTVRVQRAGDRTDLYAESVVIATGTRPARPDHVPFDGVRVVDSDELLRLPELPRKMIIVGGGVVGTEYACTLAALGVSVVLTEARDRLLDFADPEIIEALQYHMRSAGVTLRLGERVESIAVQADGLVQATMQSGKHLRAETLLYCIGRQGATEGLGLESIGLQADDRGRLAVNENYQTEVPHIYAVGDVVGFPALASTSMEQGRQAACHLCGETSCPEPGWLPFGIYTIPEISMVGKTEAELTAEGVPYESGIARYREIARGQLLGDDAGMLKLLIHEETRRLLGVHAIGAGATELIHIGQAVLAFEGTVDYFIDTVFNYPTLAECYKVAALNGVNKLRRALLGAESRSSVDALNGRSVREVLAVA
jgi:NAD(P) transhydrogenase